MSNVVCFPFPPAPATEDRPVLAAMRELAGSLASLAEALDRLLRCDPADPAAGPRLRADIAALLGQVMALREAVDGAGADPQVAIEATAACQRLHEESLRLLTRMYAAPPGR